MSTLTAQPLSLISIDFNELYARHRCRHSQFGINVVHLLALTGIWYGVYAALFTLTGTPYVPIGQAIAYFAILAMNTPLRVLVVVAIFLSLLVAAVIFVPGPAQWAFWIYLLPIPIMYKLQNWSHTVWNVERDMTEFNSKYTKGSVLFVVLLFYEVPIALNYLALDRKHWE
jgi:hypothetical protein